MRILEWKILHWDTFTELKADVKVLSAKLEQTRRQNESLRGELQKNKGKKLSYGIADMNCTLILKRPYEILCVKTRKFVQHEGFTNPKDATEYAEKLAADNPGKEFVVYGPLSTSKAEIPVATTKWVDTPPPPPEDKMVKLHD